MVLISRRKTLYRLAVSPLQVAKERIFAGDCPWGCGVPTAHSSCALDTLASFMGWLLSFWGCGTMWNPFLGSGRWGEGLPLQHRPVRCRHHPQQPPLRLLLPRRRQGLLPLPRRRRSTNPTRPGYNRKHGCKMWEEYGKTALQNG